MFGLGRSKPAQTAAAHADETREGIAAPDGWLLELFGAMPSAAGVVVSPESALRVPAVAAGVRAISEAASILPLHTYSRAADGSRERNADHIASRLLNGDANPWTRGPQLRELLTADAICYDAGGFAEIVRDGDKKPRELHRIHPSTVTIEIDTLTGEPRYRVNIGSGSRFIDFRDMLHIRAPSPLCMNTISGRSPLMQAKDAIGLLITMQAHACRLFANGARPSGILSFPQKLGAEVAKRIKASWQAATGGSNSGGTAVLEEGGSFTPLSFNSVDSQFLEIWALAITEVARILRVPPVLLMDYSRQTWANAETGGQQFLTYSLSPWLSRWESEVTLKLIAPEDRDEIYVEHLTDALLKSDFASRATAYSAYRAAGVLTANEVRAGLNLAPLPDGNVLQNPYTTTDKTKPTTPKTEGNADE
ncbi:phage portal protein [Agrobacterium rosae]|uniref:Phage portal protein, HK97 family n=1 Tax=Agrobacterium rosae TaxID=1972867 RepID=A0A1R3TWP3_9HYPH|nr:phage portal protein [Agrobacterium rosae]SCX27122.1 phage portal protein, HK97 family [Agrobacterium rosae]